jgi:leucyl aminopeptidase
VVYSDHRSTGDSKLGGGACTAAAFLKVFVNDGVNWAHIDIAGPGMHRTADVSLAASVFILPFRLFDCLAMLSSKSGHMPKGGTGFGVQLLTDFVARRTTGRAPQAATNTTPAAASTPAAAAADSTPAATQASNASTAAPTVAAPASSA